MQKMFVIFVLCFLNLLVSNMRLAIIFICLVVGYTFFFYFISITELLTPGGRLVYIFLCLQIINVFSKK